ncbi:hypothetical protein JTE90_019245 [Oedothorax gibbosus]|uniref:Uncharacterized protein n=1 Tax=Oedothorax gibbosus TaxID=931172 RepID=A0AAV6URD6_9ARAC|nr:hypothetical protein JTE90_019245 [Oedothorax gibbosus]
MENDLYLSTYTTVTLVDTNGGLDMMRWHMTCPDAPDAPNLSTEKGFLRWEHLDVSPKAHVHIFAIRRSCVECWRGALNPSPQQPGHLRMHISVSSRGYRFRASLSSANFPERSLRALEEFRGGSRK